LSHKGGHCCTPKAAAHTSVWGPTNVLLDQISHSTFTPVAIAGRKDPMGYEASLPPMAPQHGVTVVHAPGSFYGCLDTDDPVADVLCDSAPRSLVVLVIVTSPLMLDCQGTHALM
jgi:hypothetical protein